MFTNIHLVPYTNIKCYDYSKSRITGVLFRLERNVDTEKLESELFESSNATPDKMVIYEIENEDTEGKIYIQFLNDKVLFGSGIQVFSFDSEIK